MTRMKIGVAAVAFVAMSAGPAVAQSATPAAAQSPLADAARREAARREAIKARKVPVYTNEDLNQLPPRPAPVRPVAPSGTRVTTLGPGGDTASDAAQEPDAARAEAGQTQAPAAESARGTEEKWRARITAARDNLSRAKLFAEALQSRVNALSTDFVSRDDPAQRQQLFEDRQKALDEMARVKEEIAGFEKEIAAIQEEARRLNVPPGWLR